MAMARRDGDGDGTYGLCSGGVIRVKLDTLYGEDLLVRRHDFINFAAATFADELKDKVTHTVHHNCAMAR